MRQKKSGKSPVKVRLVTGQKGGKCRQKGIKSAKVMALYLDGYNAPNIAKITGYSRSHVYEIIKENKENQLVKLLPDSEGQTRPVSPVKSPVTKRNVHAQRVRAFVHFMPDSYKKSPNRNLTLVVDGRRVVVQCQGRTMLLRSDSKFWGEDEHKATWNSLSWWGKVLSRLESRLGVIVFKRDSVAFEFLYHEFETSDSVVARDASKRGNVWRVFHSDDGKLRLSVDWSGGEPCHESHHKRDAAVDSETFNRFVNNVLNHPEAPNVHELSKMVFTTQKQLYEVASGLNSVVQLLKPVSSVPSEDDVFVRPGYVG